MFSCTVEKEISEVLAKCAQGNTISKAEALLLLQSENTYPILHMAKLIRDRFKPGPITYSRKVFINLVNLCRDTCSYCTYKKEPSDKLALMMTPQHVLTIAEAGRRLRCTEALFVTGERPEQKYSQAREWLRSVGHSCTVEYISEMSEMVLHKTGLLPHTNAGSLTKKEMWT